MAARRVHRPVLTGGHQFPYTQLAAPAGASSVSTPGQTAVASVDNCRRSPPLISTYLDAVPIALEA